MSSWGINLGALFSRRTVALLASAALLCFAVGAAVFHVCHLCQALHMPALEAARLALSDTPVIVAWYTSAPQHTAPSDSFALHRASRAPPIA